MNLLSYVYVVYEARVAFSSTCVPVCVYLQLWREAVLRLGGIGSGGADDWTQTGSKVDAEAWLCAEKIKQEMALDGDHAGCHRSTMGRRTSLLQKDISIKKNWNKWLNSNKSFGFV